MTDREMLELAAKAAGRGSQWWMESVWNGPDKEWNPLTDDGDALRLAVKLSLMVDVTEGASGAHALNIAFCTEAHNSDPLAATRRAIVRAAAEIGKGME